MKSGSNRKKLFPKENATIRNGDVIELIPGHFLFEYKTLSDNENGNNAHFVCDHKRGSNDGGRAGEVEELTRKRPRQLVSQDKGSERSFKVSLF